MFGIVTASGINVLSRVDFRYVGNVYIVAISIGLGTVLVVSPKYFLKLLHNLAPILENPVLLTAISAILLKIVLNGTGSSEAVAAELAAAAKYVELV